MRKVLAARRRVFVARYMSALYLSGTAAALLGPAMVPAAMVQSASDQAEAASASLPGIAHVFADFEASQPGCGVGVMRNGVLSEYSGHGLADVAAGTGISANTLFNIASVSKQFTAFAILLLEQRKLLKLDDSIRDFLPELDGYADAVTVRHLLHHTGGLREYSGLLALSGRTLSDKVTAKETLELLARQSAPNAAAGTRFSYSNTGYFLLSQIIERASGVSLKRFAEESIFKPLAMTSTTYVDRYPSGLPIARGYTVAAGHATINESPWEQAGQGRVHTTLRDLARWDANFYTGQVGGLDLMRKLATPGTLDSGAPLDYAGGLQASEYRGLALIEHSGSWAGYRSDYLRFPTERISIAVLCNRTDARASERSRAVADIVLAHRLRNTVASERSSPPQLLAIRGRVTPAQLPSGAYLDAEEGAYLQLMVSGERASIAGQPLTLAGDRIYAAFTVRNTQVAFLPAANGEPPRVIEKRGEDVVTYRWAPGWTVGNLDEYVGTYVSHDVPARLEVLRDADALILNLGHAQARLRPGAKDAFIAESSLNSIQFSAESGARQSFRYFGRGVNGLRFERATAVAAGPAGRYEPARIPASQSRVVHSGITGSDFHVYVAKPTGPAPVGGYPVVYFLDADGAFGMNTYIARLLYQGGVADPAVLVGIGYPPAQTPKQWAAVKERRRTLDYTPLVPRSALAPRPDGSDWTDVGGADALLRFIEEELKPQIEQAFPIDRRRQTLYGHSFGGLFTLYTLFTRPEAFQTYLASSPSTWFGGRRLFQAHSDFIVRSPPQRMTQRVMITVGGVEQDTAELEREGNTARVAYMKRNRMVDGAREMAGLLAVLTDRGLELKFRILEGEDHGTAKSVGAGDALLYALKKEAES